MQVPLQAAAKKNWARLVGISVGNVQSCGHFDGGEFLARVFFGRALENDDLTGVVARPPEKIILMAADRFGQVVTRTEKVDGGGLAVVVAENGGFGLVGGRKRMIDASDGGNLLLPRKFVGVILREHGANEAALGRLRLQQRMRLVTHETVEREHGKNERQRDRNANGKPHEANRLEGDAPFCLLHVCLLFICLALVGARQQMLCGDRARCEQNRVSRSGVIIFSVRNQEKREDNHERPAEIAIRFRGAGEKIKEQAAKPERKAERIHHHDLLGQVRAGRVGDVLSGDSNVVHQFEERPVVLDIPNQVGKEDQERYGTAREKPWGEQELALPREKKSEKQSEGKNGDGIFVFEPEASDGTESEPELWVLRVNHAQDGVSAAGPKQRFEGVHGELVIADPPHRGSGGQRPGKRDAVALRAKLAREGGDQNNARGSSQRRPENKRRERSAKSVARDPGNQWEKRRQIHVAEGEMFGAREVIQRITEVAVAHRGGQMQRRVWERNNVNPQP